MKILKNSKIRLALLLSCFVFLDAKSCFAQSTTNQSTVSNSAAPSASSVTTGGTNVNTQVNNAYANDLSFGGGITCRTPKIFMTGNVGKVDAYQIDPLQDVHNQNNNYQFTAGIVLPIMSKLNKYCKEIAGEITKDRKVASELSMIKACDDLLKKNIGYGALGLNVGANKDSADRISDFINVISYFANDVDYFTINISSPNTHGLRNLQKEKNLEELLSRITINNELKKIKKPILIKISPDSQYFLDDKPSTICNRILTNSIFRIIFFAIYEIFKLLFIELA